MCKVHDKVNGQQSVELYAEARVLDNVCEDRMKYLRQQAMSFHAWLEEQAWCEDATKFCSNIVKRVERALDPDSDKWVHYIFEDNSLSRDDLDELEISAYTQELEHIANKGMSKAFSKAEKLRFFEGILEDWVTELKLHDKIQDYIDTLPPYTGVGMYLPVFRRLDGLKNDGKLGYAGWVMFSNVLMEKMNKKQYTPKYPTKDLADQITKMEEVIASINKDIQKQQEQDVVYDESHPAAEVWISLNS